MPLSSWTPAIGTARLVAVFGAHRAFELLTEMLGAESSGALARPPYAEVLRQIGGGHAERLLHDATGARLAYWPRVWAARALASFGDDDADSWLLPALDDVHWRVRMTAARSLGRLGVEGREDELVLALSDPHPRVRSAAAVALGRVGNEFALPGLRLGLDDPEPAVRRRADRALALAERRLDGSTAPRRAQGRRT